MADYILVHGAWGGGWVYDRLKEELETAGHRVVVAALAGLGTRADELNAAIDLSTHINDVVDHIAAAGFDRFILAGHSYGGMVVTGVAARLGARIDALVYIDAFVPEDGQSLWDITGQFEHDHYIAGQRDKPGLVLPLPGIEGRRLGRQPLLTLIEPVHLTGEEKKIARHAYIFATDWQPTPFARFRDAARARGWPVHEVGGGHDVMTDQPDALRAILLACAR